MNAIEAGVYIDCRAAQLLASCPPPRRALFLDRDGVINVDRAYVHRKEDTVWVPGIFDLCALARDEGMLLVVVTNQAGIARGYYDERTFLEYTAWVHDEFERNGAPILATYYCPHHPAASRRLEERECECRKPAAGMIRQAAAAHSIEPRDSILVGDKVSDIEAARRGGIGFSVLIDGGAPPSCVSVCASSLAQVAELVRERLRVVSRECSDAAH